MPSYAQCLPVKLRYPSWSSRTVTEVALRSIVIRVANTVMFGRQHGDCLIVVASSHRWKWPASEYRRFYLCCDVKCCGE